MLLLLAGIAVPQSRQASGGTLGISAADWEQGGVKGVRILEVSQDSSAGLAGLHVGYVITEVNGKHVRSIQELADVLAELDAGAKASIVYLVRTNLGWMPSEAVVILAKKDEESTSAQAKALTPTMPSVSAVEANPARPDSVTLATRVQNRPANQRAIDLPREVGVFLVKNGALVEIEPEVVNWRTGGVIKTMATAGLDKGHVNGVVAGPHSGLMTTGVRGSIEFYIRCPEGSSASEYQLLRLWDKGSRREFRAVTGGILHRTGGAQLNEVPFKFEKIALYSYKVELGDLRPGEYGFLAPGAVASANAASLGRIYTFRIPE
jgi:membrane-associated protease RseP (regulator of RpoE activity)